MKHETKNFSIEYSKADEIIISDIISTLDNASQQIMKFFKLKALKEKVKIIIWDSIEAYKKHLLPYLTEAKREYKEWMIADTFDGNINMLTISQVQTTKNRSDYNLEEFLGCVCHEFVHICHRHANTTLDNATDWFWELLATNLGNYSFCKKDVSKESKTALQKASLEMMQNNFDNTPHNYSIAYLIGHYLFTNYSEDYIYGLATDNKKLLSESPRFFEEAKKWYKK